MKPSALKPIALAFILRLWIVILLVLVMVPASQAAAGTTYLAYWHLNGNPSDSVGSYNGIMVDGSTWDNSDYAPVSGNTGSLNVNGWANGGLSAPLVTNAVDNIRMSAWFKWNGSASEQDEAIIYNGNSGPNGYGIFLETVPQRLMILCGGVTSLTVGNPINPNQWMHVTYTRYNGQMYLTLDDQLIYSGPGCTPNTPNGWTSIGYSPTAGGLNYFDGWVDEASMGTPTAPKVLSVSSTNANGSYNAGDAIDITVKFDEIVNVSAGPQLTLETGTTDQVAYYFDGSGTDTLTFRYNVQAGDASTDLDYLSTAALSLGVGSIKSYTGLDANLTLPAPGSAGSLGANKNLVIDNTAPQVSNVTSTTANGSYGAGQVIPVSVVFSEPVFTSSGTQYLLISTSWGIRIAYYSGGSGTNTLTFDYTVMAGDNSADLDYFDTTSLYDNGYTIHDAAGNNAVLTLPLPGAAGSLSANKNLVIDTTAPTVTDVSSTAADGSFRQNNVIPVTVTFTEAVTVTGTPQITLETGAVDQVVDYSSGSGTDTLTFNYTVQAGDTSADLDYVDQIALSANGGSIADLAGNTAFLFLPNPGAAGSLSANKNLVVDTTAPMVTNVTSTALNGTYGFGQTIPVTVTFSEAVTITTGTPQITLETGTTDRVVNYSSGSGTDTLTFNYTVQSGDSSTDLDYISTAALWAAVGSIQDAAGNSAALTLPAPGAAGSLGANKALVVDGVGPVVASVTSTTADGYYRAGDTLTITVTFDKPVNVTGTPLLSLETGTTDQTAAYQSGSGSSTLNFSYLVQAGDLSTDLDYASTTALSAAGGLIIGANGSPADLTLPALGGPNSIAGQKAILIDAVSPDTTITSQPANPANSTSASFSFTGSDIGSSVTGYQCSLDHSTFVTCTSPSDYAGLSADSHTFQVRSVDAAGNSDATPASYTWLIDTTLPSVAMTSTASDPTNVLPIPVTITFSEAVTGFVASDVTTGNATINNFSGSGADYTFNLVPSGQGKVSADIGAGVAVDMAGNANTAAAQFSRIFDIGAPVIDVNRAAGQTNPTSASPINFTAGFSETVVGFTAEDVTLSGTAGADTVVVTNTSGSTYNLAVSGMTGPGTVTVTIGAGVVTDSAGNPNTASISSLNLNTVTFAAPTITSADYTAFVVGHAGSFTVTTSGSPAPRLSVSGDLPAGVTFTDHHDGTATLAGTPQTGTVGSHSLTISAAPSASALATTQQSFTLTVEEVASVLKINTTPDTGDGSLDENEKTGVNITRLLVVYSKSMDLDTVSQDANYSLVKLPDTPIALFTEVQPFTNPTVVNISAGTGYNPLPEGSYQLTVKGTVKDSSGVVMGTDFVRLFSVDKTSIEVMKDGITLPNNKVIANGATLTSSMTAFKVSFSEDSANPSDDTGEDDVTNPENYQLYKPGLNGAFETTTCQPAGATPPPENDDVRVPTGPVTYDNNQGNGPYVATVKVNNDKALPNGNYRLLLCGSTSITDLAGNPLNGGVDVSLNFTVKVRHIAGGGADAQVESNPETGFAPGRVTVLPLQPLEKSYENLGSLWMEIPALGIKTSITGVPVDANGWDVTWLGKQVGWLNGTAFPTWNGNSVLTAHSYTSDGLAGAFARLKDLKYDDQLTVHFGGMKYTYVVRGTYLVERSDTAWINREETQSWLTLITCQRYDEKTRRYLNREVARAVLLKVEKE